MEFDNKVQERIIELYLGLGRTNLFRIIRTNITVDDIISYQFHLKGTEIVLSYNIDKNGELSLTIVENNLTISPGTFWENIPVEYKKVLAYHLGDLIS